MDRQTKSDTESMARIPIDRQIYSKKTIGQTGRQTYDRDKQNQSLSQ